jgi:hypothetical protein
MPDAMIVRRDVVSARERLDLRRLWIVENADAAEARKAVVILEHDYERVVEPRNSALVIFACQCLRSGRAH